MREDELRLELYQRNMAFWGMVVFFILITLFSNLIVSCWRGRAATAVVGSAGSGAMHFEM